jgi:predicted AlkP superfamily pyrophosphatase or phosphodiesterase
MLFYGYSAIGPWVASIPGFTLQKYSSGILLMPTLLAFAIAALAVGSASTHTNERHVVMILIDGLPAYLFNDPQASLPVIRGLARESVVANGGMRMSDPTITWPNQTSLIPRCQGRICVQPGRFR